MNARRRKELGRIYDMIEKIADQLEMLKDEEQEAYDNMPEQFQEGERGEQMYGYIDKMDNACDTLRESMDFISDVIYDE